MRYIHLKTRDVYNVLCEGVLEKDLTPVVIYYGMDGRVWVRPSEEFYDGRFDKLGKDDDPGPARHPVSD